MSKLNLNLPSDVVVLTDDGGYCWFQSPRAIVEDGTLLIGSVASGHLNPDRKGSVELVVHKLKSASQTGSLNETSIIELAKGFELDDHDSASLYRRTDGSYLACWAAHGTDQYRHYATSEVNNPQQWNKSQIFVPSESTQITYSNLVRLQNQSGDQSSQSTILFDFFRGLHGSFKPSFSTSCDDGLTWKAGSVVIDVPSEFKHRPYVRYCDNGNDTVHLIYSEAHPRDFDNSIYHIYFKLSSDSSSESITSFGSLHRSDGSVIRSLENGLKRPDEGTLVYSGDAQHVAWPMDCVLDGESPVIVYSVQYNSAGLPVGQGGDDIRYRYARWDDQSKKWIDHEFAHAGCRLYVGEDDYTGLVAIEPNNPSVVYISTNANPTTGEPLISTVDNKRHWEIYTAVTSDGGQSWSFTPITSNSTHDNLRPIRPKSSTSSHSDLTADSSCLVWLAGEYRTYTDYSQAVVLKHL